MPWKILLNVNSDRSKTFLKYLRRGFRDQKIIKKLRLQGSYEQPVNCKVSLQTVSPANIVLLITVNGPHKRNQVPTTRLSTRIKTGNLAHQTNQNNIMEKENGKKKERSFT